MVLTLEETEEASVTMPDLAFGLQSGVIDVRLSDEYTDVTFTVTEGADVVSVDAVGRVTLLKGGSAVVTVRAAKADGAVWERRCSSTATGGGQHRAFAAGRVRHERQRIRGHRHRFPGGRACGQGVPLYGGRRRARRIRRTADLRKGRHGRLHRDGQDRVCRRGDREPDGGRLPRREWSEGRSVTLRSTYGGLDEGGFTLTQDGSPVADGAQYTVANIGESLTFVLGTDFSPADFVPDADSVAVHAEGGFLDAEAVQENGVWKFVLTARKPTDGAATPSPSRWAAERSP